MVIEHILAPNPSLMTGPGTNTYLISQGRVAIIDPGPDIPAHIDAILAAAERQGRIEALLVTHYHPDHLPAARALQQKTGAPLYAHPSIGGVDRALHDDERIHLHGLEVRALYTPGHTQDHFCFYLESEGWLFTGDLVAGAGTVVIGPPDGNLGDYMASLERLLRLAAGGKPLTRILPGHGPMVDRPEEKLEEYLSHRRMRETQVLEALEQGRTRVEAIVPVLYADVDARLHPVAARNVIAHLLKLEQDGRVERRGENWYRVAGR